MVCLALFVGCVQIFDLEDPSHAGDDDMPSDEGSGSGSGTGSGEDNSTPCSAGVVVDGRCFERFPLAPGWDLALDLCNGLGFRLAKLETQAIRSAVGTLLALSDEAYIGGSDVLRNGKYDWIDGTPVNMEDGWQLSQPDFEIDEYCMTMQNTGIIGFLDTNCDEIRDYICERELP